MSDSKYTITRYNHPDQNWLNVVLALRSEFGAHDSDEPFISFITSRLQDETMLLVIAWDGEIPIGYGLAFDVESDPAKPEWTRTGYISQILIAKNYRRHGIGNFLMDHIDQWFNERGLKKILLNVNLDNENGASFWRKRGFTSYALRMKRMS